MIGASLLAAAPIITACEPVERPVGQIGFTVDAPQPGLKVFERDVRAIRDLGANWVRFGVVGHQIVTNWSESGRVVLDQDRLEDYDDAFDLVESLGMSVCLLTVDGAPATRNTPEYLDAMRQYLDQLASRFGSSTAVWQVYNEANDIDFRTAGRIEGDLDVYLADLDEALGVASEAIHARASHVRVTTSASGYPVDDEREEDWLRFFAGVGTHLDMSTINLYPVLSDETISSLPDRIERLEQAQGLPVSVGEFGLQTGPGLYTEGQQVESLTKTIAALAQTRATPVFIYRLRNDGAHNDDGFGLFEIDGTPKSSVPEIAEAIAASYPRG